MNGEFLKLRRESPRNDSPCLLVVVALSEEEPKGKNDGLYIGTRSYHVHVKNIQTGETVPNAIISIVVEEKGGRGEEVVYLCEIEGGDKPLSDEELEDLRFSFVDWGKVED